MALNAGKELLANDFINLKQRVKNEMNRRIGKNSLVEYGSSSYDYTVAPDIGVIAKTEHINKIIVPLNAIAPTGEDLKDPGDIMKNIKNLETKLSGHETMSTAQDAATDCKGGCNGLCSTGCFSGCKTNCTGGCNTTCTGGCKTGCSGCTGCGGSCSRNCSSTCTGDCEGSCTGGCKGSCKSSCTGECKGSCRSSCTGRCKTTCTATCANSCNNNCKGGCTGCGSGCGNTCNKNGCTTAACMRTCSLTVDMN